MRISDWSSDVCSSDLIIARNLPQAFAVTERPSCSRLPAEEPMMEDLNYLLKREQEELLRARIAHGPAARRAHQRLAAGEIGRASGRERVWQDVEISVVCVSLKKKQA